MKTLLVILAASLAVPLLALLYFISDNPAEFTAAGCGGPDVAGALDLVREGCLDVRYVLHFVFVYGGVLFLVFAASWGALHLADRRRPPRG